MTDPGGNRKLAAILAADVAKHSRLIQENDEATVATSGAEAVRLTGWKRSLMIGSLHRLPIMEPGLE